MKTLNFVELNSYVYWIQQMLLGAQLQDVWTNDRHLVLEFYKFRNIWLLLDLDNTNPQLILIQKETPTVHKRPKPIGLFIASHARGLRVESMRTCPQWGRVVQLQVSSRERSCLIEMQLAPTAVNVIVTSSEVGTGSSQKAKKISWAPVRELPLVPQPTSDIQSSLEEQWLAREDEWWMAQRPTAPKTDSAEKPKTDFAKVLAKKQKALETLSASLSSFDEVKWFSLGEVLKNLSPKARLPDDLPEDLPEDFKKMVKADGTPSENMALAFKKGKEVLRKKQGALERIEKLKAEIHSLSTATAESTFIKQQGIKSSGTKSLLKAEARGRKLFLEAGIEAVCGRSGRDNLAILRQARAWDLWLHLKDYPGAHAIIFRDKNKIVKPALIEKVCEWVIRESPAAKGFAWGAKYDVVVAETRFVRPIKGDSLGRVTYQNPTVYTFASKAQKG